MAQDALMYASMTNSLTSNDQLANISKSLIGTYKFTTGTVDQNNAAIQNLNKLLNKTQIKRACCNNTSKVNVRIPLPPNEVLATGSSSALLQKYQYYDKQIDVPISTPGFCTIDGVTYTQNSPDCDDFYNVYCMNVVNEFTNGNGGVFNDADFVNYKPECACYQPEPSWLAQALSGTPTPKCFYPGCSIGQAYLDPISRNENCDLTICNQAVNIGSADVSQNSSLILNIKAECGAQGKHPFASSPAAEAIQPPLSPPPSTPSYSNTYLYGGIFCCLFIIILIGIYFYYQSKAT